MYILEVPGDDHRKAILLQIINTIYEKSFEEISQSLVIAGLSYLESSDSTKTNKIAIKDIKEFKKALWKTNEEQKLAIINNAHQLTHEAQNALLKDLEDAPESSIIILALPDIRLVLPTIRSRGMHIKAHEIGLIHPSIDEEKFEKIVYNRGNSTNEHIINFIGMSLYDQLLYITKELEKGKKGSMQGDKHDEVESFLKDLLSYYELSSDFQKAMMIEDDLEKIEKGVKSSTVIEHLILQLHNG